MPKFSTAGAVHISTRYLSIVLILISTAIPYGFRYPHLSLSVVPGDLFMNVVLYIPFGVAFASDGLRQVLWRSAVLSTVVEFAQLFFIGRFSQPADVLANMTGALLGISLVALSLRSSRLRLNWPVSVITLAGAGLWVVICPALSEDYRWLIHPPASLVELILRGGPAIMELRAVCVLVNSGPPANAAFLALLIVISLTGLVARESRSQSAIGSGIAAIAACLLLQPQNPAFYPLCILTALATTASFTFVTYWSERNAERQEFSPAIRWNGKRLARYSEAVEAPLDSSPEGPYEGGGPLLEPSPDDGS